MKYTGLFLKNYKTIFLLGGVAIFAICCNSAKPAVNIKSTNTTAAATKADPLMPVETDLAIAKTHWPTTTFDNLKTGYSIYSDKCTDCHDAKLPQEFDVDDWTVIMRKMGRKAKLDSTQYQEVFHYILTRREAILGSHK